MNLQSADTKSHRGDALYILSDLSCHVLMLWSADTTKRHRSGSAEARIAEAHVVWSI